MTHDLKPWAYGPFEVLLHAEMHYRTDDDRDRRIALIGFDNAIEVAITTYLNLNPIQRRGKEYKRVDVDRWLTNFHTKIRFFFEECDARGTVVVVAADEMVWYHDVRNGQYHIGGATIPQRRELEGVRRAAIEVLSVLFDEPNVDALLDEHIAGLAQPAMPARNDTHDRVIDNSFGMVEICGQPEYTSEILYALDPNRYREVALELLEEETDPPPGDPIP